MGDASDKPLSFLVCVDGAPPRLCRSHGHRAWCRFPPARNSRSGAVGSSPNKSNSFHCAGGAVVKRRWLCAVFTAELTSTVGLIGASGHQARFPRSLLPLLPPPHANPPSFRTAPTFCSTRALLMSKKPVDVFKHLTPRPLSQCHGLRARRRCR